MKNQMRNTLEESIELMNSTEVSLRKLENESLFNQNAFLYDVRLSHIEHRSISRFRPYSIPYRILTDNYHI